MVNPIILSFQTFSISLVRVACKKDTNSDVSRHTGHDNVVHPIELKCLYLLNWKGYSRPKNSIYRPYSTRCRSGRSTVI